LAVRKDNTTGLEYTRSLTDEEQKQRAAASVNRIYSIATYVFVIGILSVGALFVISIFNKSPTEALICEATVLICLIALLILVSRARRRMNEQRIQSERYPYSGVDKKEIDKIFDLIAEEEKKRERLNIFATGGRNSAPAPQEIPTRDRRPEPPEKPEVREEPVIPIFPEPTDETPTADEKSEEEETVSVLEDELNDVEIRMRAMAGEDEESSEAAPRNESAQSEEPAEERPRREKRPRDPSRQRPPQGGKGKKRPPEGAPRDPRDPRAPQGAKRRRPPMPYDPYYGGVYYDEYGRPIRRPPPAYDPYYGGEYYYDEYGNPIRRRETPPRGKERVVYDEYGRPIRRRPPAAGQGQEPRRKRPAPPGAEQPARRRPEGAAPASSAARQGAQRPAAPIDPAKRTAAPVAMPSLKKDFDEDYVPVSIAYDDDVNDTAYDADQGVVLRANQGKRGASAPAAPPKPVIDDESDYSPADMEAVPIIVDDDYNPDYGEEDFGVPAAPSRTPAAQHKAPGAPRNVPDYYYQGDEDDSPVEHEAVIVVHDFDDIDQDEYDARYSRDFGYSSPAAPQKKAAAPSYAVEEESYTYEDEEGVVVLPRDENYEEYLKKVQEEEERKRAEEEKRRIEERKQARRQSGKVALTIRKVRRKKIHRMSRKYKRFRASVIPLNKFLQDFKN